MVTKTVALLRLLETAWANNNKIYLSDVVGITQNFGAQDKLKILHELLILCGRKGIRFIHDVDLFVDVDRLDNLFDCAKKLLDTSRSHGGKISWSEFNTIAQRFALDDAQAPADAASFMLLKEQLGEVLDTLTAREKSVPILRFGLNDGKARTLEEVGKSFNVTRERIREIESKALRKLRHLARSKKLKDFLD